MTDFATGFVEKNFPTILGIAKDAFESVDSSLQISLRTAYIKYIDDAYGKYSKSRSFFNRQTPVDLYEYYIPARLIYSHGVLDNPGVLSCVEKNNRLIISGTAGSGKSMLAKHLFMDGLNCDDYAPVLVELRGLNDGKTLRDLLREALGAFNFSSSDKYFEKANRAGHFFYVFDGYDEVEFDKRASLITELSQMGCKYRKCPIVITSRPEEELDGLSDFSVASILPLDLQGALELVRKLPMEEDLKQKFCHELTSHLFVEKGSFLSNPLLLSIMLLTYGENAEIPQRKSIFYQQAFDALFRRHDSYKGGFKRARKTTLDSFDFSKVFAVFALQNYESRLFKMSRTDCLGYFTNCKKVTRLDFSPDDMLHDCLKAVCILVEDGLDVAYTHRSFQEYFVAHHISISPPDVQKKLISRYGSRHKSDDVIELLYEINPNLVERLLILPYAEKFVLDLNIDGAVTADDVCGYLNRKYSGVTIKEKNIIFKTKVSDPKFLLLRKVAAGYGGYTAPPRSYFENFYSEIRKELGLADGKIHEEEGFSLESRVVSELLNGKGYYSVEYFQSIQDGLIELKKRQSENINDLNELLGI